MRCWPGLALLPCIALQAAVPAIAQVPSFEAVRAAHAPSDVPLLDRHGAQMQLFRTEPRVRRGPWVRLEDVSPAMRLALVLGEDRRYWDHGGVDWRSLAASAWANAWNTRTRGASTLTMQLAAMSDEALARPAGGRGVAQKISQMLRAREFESAWTKAQILEAYLNRVPLRGETVGISAAAGVLFGKHPSGLDEIEASILAALVRAPNAGPAAIERRACDVLRHMAHRRPGDCAGLATTLAQALQRRPGPLPASAGDVPAPHLAARLAAGAAPGQPLRSTLDARVQRIALQALRQQLAELRGRNVEDGAVVVLDNASGDVLAWVGSSGPALSQAASVDAVLARRQPGSTVKPFVYALALQRRLITPSSWIADAPLQLDAGGGALYLPQNYDHGYKGNVSARTALASSLNVPAVRIAAMLGPDALYDKLVEAGLRPTESAGYHGQALALGSAETSLLDLANAYRMLANGGRYTPVRWGTGAGAAGGAAVSPARAVFEPGVAWLVGDMLSDATARAPTFGLDSALATRGWAAVKTGTSKDMRDNWCVGWTARYTVAAWVGNAGGAPMHGVSGTSGAAPVWHEVVAALHAASPSLPPPPPPGVQRLQDEWFLADTGPALEGVARPFGIRTPGRGSIVVLDPDIPMAAQKLVFEGAAGRWRLDGQAVGEGTRVTWLPRPGRHVLELDGGSSRDRVEFEVRATHPAARPGTGPIRRPVRRPAG